MNNQKIENQLNLAIEATPQEREKSMDLDVGFNRESVTWEVIVKFYGTADELHTIFLSTFPNEVSNIKIIDLIGKYMILEIPENLVDRVAELPEIEYMEKPKRLFFAVNNGRSASCINSLQTGVNVPRQMQNGAGMSRQMVTLPAGLNSMNNLTGRGTIVAVIDSGERVIIMSS